MQVRQSSAQAAFIHWGVATTRFSTKPGSDLMAALLVLGLEPDCGLPVYCVAHVTFAPTVWGRAQLEGDRGCNCSLRTRGLENGSGYSRFSWVAGWPSSTAL